MRSETNPAVWLSALCDLARDPFKTPWTFRHEGKSWTYATNGHILAASRFDVGYPKSPRGNGPTVRETLFAPMAVAPQPFPLADVCAILSPPVRDDLPPCDVCTNSGRIACEECVGEGQVECCCYCGHEHEKDCEHCTGNGYVRCTCGRAPVDRSSVHVCRIGGALFNLSLLARALPFLPTDRPATWQQDGPRKFARLTVGEWIVAVMPLHSSSHPVEHEWLVSAPVPQTQDEQ